ncbi:MAG: radical SAM protein [Cyanobacteria bacterium SIG29]|nr:radical SAM protein [Cyanobacteria bacterium SIG29]
MLDRLKKYFNNPFQSKIEKIDCVSCDCLNERLVFFGDKVAYCSNGNPSNKMSYPLIYDNYNGDFEINKFSKIVQKNRLNILKGKYNSSCEGCSNLKKQKWFIDASKFPKFKYIQFSGYSLCNSKCVYCNSWTNTKQEGNSFVTKNGQIDSYEIMPIIKDLIRKNMITEDTVIDFAGGEPTLYREFEQSLDYFLNFGTKKMMVFSNVIKFSQIIEKGLKQGIITLTVSVDAGSQQIHKKIKGVDSYEKVWQNLQKYASCVKFKNQIVSKFVIVPDINDDICEITEWVRKSKEIGITNLILNADNRIFEKEVDKDLMLKLKKLGEEFLLLGKQENMLCELYSNMIYASSYI